MAGDDLSAMTVDPPRGHPDRHRWRDKQQPRGPVGLVMQHTYMMGAALNFATLAVVRDQRADIPILDTPYQLVKPTMARLAFNALHTHYTTTRTMLAQAKEIDPNI